MKSLCTTVLMFLATAGPITPIFGQQPVANDLVAAAMAAAQSHYDNSFVASPQLYNGPEYIDYSQRYHARRGHQFFLGPEKRAGSVYYNGHYFSNLRLSYDVVLDQLVILQPTSPLNLRLINEHVSSFFIEERYFIRLLNDSSTSRLPGTGYYEVLMEDPRIQLLAKRAKRLQELPTQGALDVEFITRDILFLKKAGTYFPLTNKRNLVRLFADHKREVQQYINEKRLQFGKDALEASVVHLVLYYSSLPPPQ